MVEQRIENPRVDGSIPPLATKRFKQLGYPPGVAFLLYGLTMNPESAYRVIESNRLAPLGTSGESTAQKPTRTNLVGIGIGSVHQLQE